MGTGELASAGASSLDGKESGRWELDSIFNYAPYAGRCSDTLGFDCCLDVFKHPVAGSGVEAAQLACNGLGDYWSAIGRRHPSARAD